MDSCWDRSTTTNLIELTQFCLNMINYGAQLEVNYTDFDVPQTSHLGPLLITLCTSGVVSGLRGSCVSKLECIWLYGLRDFFVTKNECSIFRLPVCHHQQH